MKHNRIVLVGCGSVAANHLLAISDIEGISVVALCDIRRERAEAYRNKYAADAAVFTEYHEMFDKTDFDTVHITTPHYLHCEMACEALRRGKNVFLEKPVAISEEQIRLLLEAEAASTGRICVCFQNRYNEVTLAAKNLVREFGGVEGARAMVTWKRTEPYYSESDWRGSYTTEGGGVMINQAIHTLDLVLGFCGRVSTVTATTANHHLKGIIEVEDTCEALLGFENGAKAIFHATTAFCLDAPNMIELFCPGKHRITMLGDNLYLDGEPVRDNERFRTENAVTPGKQCWGNGHRKLIGMYYNALESGAPMPVPLASAADTVRVLLAAYHSSDRTVVLLPKERKS